MQAIYVWWINLNSKLIKLFLFSFLAYSIVKYKWLESIFKTPGIEMGKVEEY